MNRNFVNFLYLLFVSNYLCVAFHQVVFFIPVVANELVDRSEMVIPE